MKYYTFTFVVLFLSLATGCSNQMAQDVDPSQAGEHLRTALEAWKNGKTRAELEDQSPSIVMNDAAWTSGNQLLEFKMDDAGHLDGRQMLWEVQMKLQDKAGKVSNQKITYIIDTNPRIVIVRNPFATRAAS
jgi:hypothetical protein